MELFIRAAEGLIEKRTSRAIMRQTFRLQTTSIERNVGLWYPPMEGEITVKSITTMIADVEKSVAIETAKLRTVGMLPSLRFAAIVRPIEGEFTIEYETGVADANLVPAQIRQAVLLLAGHFYRNREAAQTDPRVSSIERTLPFGVEDLIAAFVIPNVSTPYYAT